MCQKLHYKCGLFVKAELVGNYFQRKNMTSNVCERTYLTMSYITAVLLVCFSESGNVILEDGSLPDIASLCPYTEMCNSSVVKAINDSSNTPCCQKCSCSSDCHVVGNCCPDVKLNDNISLPIYPCVNVGKVHNEERGLSLRQVFDLWFHVIDSCQDKRSEEAYPACKIPIELNDFVMVSDKAEEKVFKNRHCAMCNGIQDYVFWDMLTYCNMLLSKTFQTFDEQNDFLLRECSLISLPPQASIVEKTRCYPDDMVYRRCYDSEAPIILKNACETERLVYNTRFFVNTIRGIKTFANVYCYMCYFSEARKSIKDICPLDGTTVQKHTKLFTTLIYFNVEKKNIKTSLCRSMEIWDPFDAVCRPLFCQIEHIPFNGVCKKSISIMSQITVKVLFHVDTTKQFEASQNLVRFIAEELRRLGGRHSYCAECDSHTFHVGNNTSELYFEWQLQTTRQCSVHMLLKFLGNVAEIEEFQMQYKDTERSVNISLRITFDSPEEQLRVLGLKTMDKFCDTFYNIDRVTLQNCPRIEFPSDEVTGLNLKAKRMGNKYKRMLVMSNVTNKTSVCVEDYFILQGLAHNGQDITCISSVLLIAALFVCLCVFF